MGLRLELIMTRGFRNVGSFDNEKGLHIAHINMRSIRNKIDDCKIMYDNCNLDVITCSESWLEGKNETGELVFEGFNTYRWDRTWLENGKEKCAGGLLIYVKKQYVVIEGTNLPKISSKDIEIHSLVISRTGQKNILILNVYRPPQGDTNIFWDEVKDFMSTIPHRNRYELYMLGDMNINMLDDKSEVVSNFKQGMMGYGLINYINVPTRYAESDTCIDLVFTNCDTIVKAGCVEFGLSDHEMVYVTSKGILPDTREKQEFVCRRMKGYSKENLIKGLRGFNWNNYYTDRNVDRLWETVVRRIRHVMDIICPLVKYKIKEVRKPWVTQGMIEEIKEKDRALSKAKRSKDNERIALAKRDRNRVSKISKKAKREHVVDKLEENRNDPERFWQEIRKVLPNNNAGVDINLVNQTTGKLIENKEVSTMINEYFTGIGEKLSSDNNSIWTADFPRVDDNIQSWDTSEEEVIKYFKEIKTHKTSAIDGLNSSVMKDAFLVSK